MIAYRIGREKSLRVGKMGYRIPPDRSDPDVSFHQRGPARLIYWRGGLGPEPDCNGNVMFPNCAKTKEDVIQPRPRILLVEDVGLHRKLFRDLLGAYGFDVLELEDGTDLWEKIGDVRIDAALIDVFLPQISGIMVVAALRTRWSAAAFPIIGVSAMPYADIRQDMIAAGANAYYAKPVGLRELAARFTELLGYRRP